MNNNFFTTINLGLWVPLFNASQVRNKIKLAKIEIQNTELIKQRFNCNKAKSNLILSKYEVSLREKILDYY